MAAASMASISTGGSSADLRTKEQRQRCQGNDPFKTASKSKTLKKEREIPEGRKSAGGGCSGPGKPSVAAR